MEETANQAKALDGNRKRSASKDDDTDTGADEEARVAKRAKKVKGLLPATIRLALSGYKRWVGMARKEGDEKVSKRHYKWSLTLLTVICSHVSEKWVSCASQILPAALI